MADKERLSGDSDELNNQIAQALKDLQTKSRDNSFKRQDIINLKDLLSRVREERYSIRLVVQDDAVIQFGELAPMAQKFASKREDGSYEFVSLGKEGPTFSFNMIGYLIVSDPSSKEDHYIVSTDILSLTCGN